MTDTITQPSWMRLLGIVILTVVLLGGLMTSGFGATILLLSGMDAPQGMFNLSYFGSLLLCQALMGVCLAGLFSILKYLFSAL